HPVRLPETALDFARLERDPLVDVPLLAVVVDAGGWFPDRVADRQNRLERLVLDPDGVHGLESNVLVQGRHGRDRVSHESHLVGEEGVLVLAYRMDGGGAGQIKTP